MKVVINSEGKKTLWQKGDLHSSKGVIKEKDIKSGKIKSHLGKEFTVFEASFIDKLTKLQRAPAITIKKDIGEIIAHTGINSNSEIVDAGTGSGFLAAFLANISKNVTSYEKNKEFFKIAKKNLEFLNIKIKLKNQDIYKGISEKNLDLITLDLLEPWKVVKHAKKSLKSGGFLVAFVTNVNQVIKLVENLQDFYLEKVLENIEREWEVQGLKVRPKNKILGHTGFLVFARRI